MHVKKIVIKGHRPYYAIAEAFRVKGDPSPKTRILANLGHTKDPDRAYSKAVAQYLRAAERVSRLEVAMAGLAGKA